MKYRKLYKDHFNIEFGREYVIHHIDGNHNNDDIDNLLLLPAKLHSKYHFQKQIIEEVPLPTKITGNGTHCASYYLSCLDSFLETLRECNKWYDYKMYLMGCIPNIHGIFIEMENQPQLNTNNQLLIIKEIVAYLNEKAQPEKPYRATNQKTQKHINARLNDGYTLDDFKTVIDKKVDEWKGTEMEKYLRPETLFGTKFESYLNAKVNKPQSNKKKAIVGGVDIERREYSDDLLNNLFTLLDEEDE